MHSRRRAQRICLPFRYTLLIPVLERSTCWGCCDCSRRSMEYEVSSTKAGLHFSENLWQHKLSTNSFLPCRPKSRAECLTQCGLRSYKERSLCRSVLHGFSCSASSKAQTTCICGTGRPDHCRKRRARASHWVDRVRRGLRGEAILESECLPALSSHECSLRAF